MGRWAVVVSGAAALASGCAHEAPRGPESYEESYCLRPGRVTPPHDGSDVAVLVAGTRTVAELDCEQERAEQAAVFLEHAAARKERYLTATAIALGASAAITAGVLNLRDKGRAAEYVAILTGVGESTLGVAILTTEPRTSFRHARNHLRDVWMGPPRSAVFPPDIWVALNRPAPGEEDGRTRRQALRDRWRQALQKTGFDDEETIDLLMGPGGSHSADSLRLRAAFLDQLQAELALDLIAPPHLGHLTNPDLLRRSRHPGHRGVVADVQDP